MWFSVLNQDYLTNLFECYTVAKDTNWPCG